MIASSRKDRRWLKKCIGGDKKACERFVREFSDLVYRSVRHTLWAKDVSFNQEDLEDLHNTVFLQLFENQGLKLRQFKGKNGCGLGTWIRVITVRIVLNHIRKKGLDSITGQKKRIPLEDIPELSFADFGPLAEIEKAENRQSLKDGIRKLPPRDRLFLLLHYENGYSLKEVAESMKLSLDNAYIIKHRAIQKIKSMLEIPG
jgi:RNA polymerase sigma-70 factor (ECF subfamily)